MKALTFKKSAEGLHSEAEASKARQSRRFAARPGTARRCISTGRKSRVACCHTQRGGNARRSGLSLMGLEDCMIASTPDRGVHLEVVD